MITRAALFLLVFATLTAWADGENCFTIRSKNRCLATSAAGELGGCKIAKGKTPNCDAVHALQGAKIGMISGAELSGGKEPGAVLCRKLKGSVVIGFDGMGNEQGFCFFADGSFLKNPSLWQSAEDHEP